MFFTFLELVWTQHLLRKCINVQKSSHKLYTEVVRKVLLTIQTCSNTQCTIQKRLTHRNLHLKFKYVPMLCVCYLPYFYLSIVLGIEDIRVHLEYIIRCVITFHHFLLSTLPHHAGIYNSIGVQ